MWNRPTPGNEFHYYTLKFHTGGGLLALQTCHSQTVNCIIVAVDGSVSKAYILAFQL